jgi:hypothetical protein
VSWESWELLAGSELKAEGTGGGAGRELPAWELGGEGWLGGARCALLAAGIWQLAELLVAGSSCGST